MCVCVTSYFFFAYSHLYLLGILVEALLQLEPDSYTETASPHNQVHHLQSLHKALNVLLHVHTCTCIWTSLEQCGEKNNSYCIAMWRHKASRQNSNQPCLSFSFSGSQLYILNPFSIPHAKHPESEGQGGMPSNQHYSQTKSSRLVTLVLVPARKQQSITTMRGCLYYGVTHGARRSLLQLL